MRAPHSANRHQGYLALAAGGCRYDAYLGTRLLAAGTRQPLLDGARALLRLGFDPTTVVVLKHIGPDTECLRGRIGTVAGLNRGRATSSLVAPSIAPTAPAPTESAPPDLGPSAAQTARGACDDGHLHDWELRDLIARCDLAHDVLNESPIRTVVNDEAVAAIEAAQIEVPTNLKEQVRAVLDEQSDLRGDDAIQIVIDRTQLDRVRAEKQKAKKKSGDFTDADEDEGDDE
jgi:hypothetical protein